MLFLVLVLLSTFTASSLAQSGEIGRLFSTPEERARLDEVRHHKKPRFNIEAPPPVQPLIRKPPPQKPVFFNGMIRRDNGETVYWVNGGQTTKPGHSGYLKPGQTWDPRTGQVYEGQRR